ncbi:MAG: nitrile hydratase subunit alpha [Solirubrobacteraceae bacterium]|nr:nitrile hydratase subunit alpha [Solirubrobacteraceae bacterium]MEA2275398.1 nitrile hydratase subunit alpha [Solirubrobacteraceae bacterium]MEA2359942.1 nitrile hydratase subunit alpha [Solirubrobacteraceae bacterium]MEA2393216.1 nitrile hydratase subunit alpha [Solirubrobacteraceae bacterium]
MTSPAQVNAGSHSWLSLDDIEARVRALESLLVEKGLAEHEAVDAVVSAFENDMGPMNGAKVVARAWTDPEYKQWLLDDATAAIADMGFTGLQTEHMVAVENTPERHNVIVCTLCSCYPWTLLGIPPAWFKYPQYRARVVEEPRDVLREFGVELSDDVKIDVWDTSAEIRFLVIPQRPAGTDGMSQDELAKLVSRDAMTGVALAEEPAGRR